MIIHSGLVAGLAECLDYLKALDDAQAASGPMRFAQLVRRSSADSSSRSMLCEQLLDGLCTHADAEIVLVLFAHVAVLSSR